LLGACFETYELFISLIFQLIFGRGKPRITETMDTESADMGALLYFKSQFAETIFKSQGNTTLLEPSTGKKNDRNYKKCSNCCLVHFFASCCKYTTEQN
jgi:hypothetical protein